MAGIESQDCLGKPFLKSPDTTKEPQLVRAAARESFKPRRNSYARCITLQETTSEVHFTTYLMLTLIALGFASSFFGKLRRNTPSLYSASIDSALIFGGSVNER